MRKIIELNTEWLFSRIESKKMIHPLDVQTTWKEITVPHDWDREGPFLENSKTYKAGGYAPAGKGAYKRLLDLSEISENQIVRLYFDGIYMDSTIWLNKTQIETQLYGYGCIDINISNYLSNSQLKSNNDNWLCVNVNNSKIPNSRWYTGSGIYRRVFMLITEQIYIPFGGVKFTTPKVSKEEANLNFEISVTNQSATSQEITPKITLLSPLGKKIEIKGQIQKIQAKQTEKIILSTTIQTPILWDINNPNLYNTEILLLSNNSQDVIDTINMKVGIRFFEFNDKGFFLNGTRRMLKGVNLHHDGGCVGTAVPPDVWRRRFLKLKEIGCNAIRTSHNTPAFDFLNLCDEMGFVVIDEVFDEWNHIKMIQSWTRRGFKKQWKKEVKNFILRDRNHPSIILWSMGNEIRRINKKEVKNWYIKLRDHAKEFDSSRPITTGLSPMTSIRDVKAKKGPFVGDLVDVICTNYAESYFSDNNAKYPGKAMISGEAYHYWRRKHPREVNMVAKEGHSNYTEQNPWFEVIKYPYAVGMFLWVGIEYLGEVRDPYPYHGRTNAPIRITGYRKPQSYFVETIWNPEPCTYLCVLDEQDDIPRGKIHFDFPKVVRHWDFKNREGEKFKVFTYTNCESVEVIQNGKSLGIKQSSDYPDNNMDWTIEYLPGSLQAIGTNNGNEVFRDELTTTTGAQKLSINPNKTSIISDWIDCLQLEMIVVDDQGHRVIFENDTLNIETQGNIQLIGIDGGDLSSHELYHGNNIKTYRGQALAIFKSLPLKNTQNKNISTTSITINSEKFGQKILKINLINRFKEKRHFIPI
jgi:beta-galactosidase